MVAKGGVGHLAVHGDGLESLETVRIEFDMSAEPDTPLNMNPIPGMLVQRTEHPEHLACLRRARGIDAYISIVCQGVISHTWYVTLATSPPAGAMAEGGTRRKLAAGGGCRHPAQLPCREAASLTFAPSA